MRLLCTEHAVVEVVSRTALAGHPYSAKTKLQEVKPTQAPGQLRLAVVNTFCDVLSVACHLDIVDGKSGVSFIRGLGMKYEHQYNPGFDYQLKGS